jgi:3-methylfumaryl-CoA hydratase
MDTSLSELQAWTGRSETWRDQIGATPVKALNATLDHPAMPADPGTPLPPLWHWLYFLPLHRQSEIGVDCHGKAPCRWFAAAPHAAAVRVPPARAGDVEHVTIADGRGQGRRTVSLIREGAHESVTARLTAIAEFRRHRLSRGAGWRRFPQRADAGAAWQRDIVPDDVLLFRYSALTFNGHRILYVRKYVTEVEGYPGLIVHGPLIATLLMDLVRRNAPDRDVVTFRFKAVRPTFDLNPFRVNGQLQDDGKTVKLWAQDHEGWLTMDAVVTLR